MTKRIIAVDIDDVLSGSAAGLAKYSNERWNADVAAEDYDEDWAKFWRVSPEEAIRRADELHEAGVFGRHDPIAEALPAVIELKKHYKLIVVTSRRRRLQAETEAWLDRNFPGVFSEVHYAGFFDNDASAHDVKKALVQHKADLCRELGANYLIDDQLKHCIAAADCGVQALLFGNYRWNRMDKLPKGITEVHGWEDVRRYFNAKS